MAIHEPIRSLGRRTLGWGERLLRRAQRAGVSESAILVALSVTVGIVVGFAILGFYALIDLSGRGITAIVFGLPIPIAATRVALLTVGLVLTRLVVVRGTGDSQGENIPDVVHAVARRRGVIQTVPVLWKTLAAALTLGAGGSVGAEGPVAVVGAGLGSRIGQWIDARPDRLRLLVACGTSAGIAGAFGAPLAGIFFALEKLLGARGGMSLAPLAVAAAAAAAVTRNGLGGSKVILIPGGHTVGGARDLVLYAVVGLLGGVVAVAYSRGVWRTGDVLRWLPSWARLLLAALVVGWLSSLFDFRLWGGGYQHLDFGLVSGQTAGLLLALAAAKLAATAFTLGGGGIGGVFTPALVIGGTFGAGLAAALGMVWPEANLDPVAAGLVGMSAVVAGSIHAPLTAIFMVIEMSGDWNLALPLLLGGSLAYLTARRLHPESIYSEWLARRGERISHGADESLLADHEVGEALQVNPITIQEQDRLVDVLPLLRRTSQLEYPVLDAEGRLRGLLRWDAVKAVLVDGAAGERTIAELAQPASETVTPEDTLATALQRLGLKDAQLLPVVAREDDRHLVGVIGRAEIFGVYDRAAD
jgi:CIC family chloride channel protein